MMRLIRLILMPAALVLLMSGPVVAQEWVEFYSAIDLFKINMPGKPTVEEIKYASYYGNIYPGRVYRLEEGPNRYSVTVVDYGNVQKLHQERLTNCQKYPNLCNNPWVGERRGAIDYAVRSFLQRDARVTDYAYSNVDRIEGRRIQLTNADRSRTFAAIHMHDNRLYILEGTVPAGAPVPGLFQQSLGFLDKDGIRVRYEAAYSNEYPPPPRVQYQAPQGQGQQPR
jgi:hypothetical protein